MTTLIEVNYWSKPLVLICKDSISDGYNDFSSVHDIDNNVTGTIKRKIIYLLSLSTGKAVCRIPLEHTYVKIIPALDFPQSKDYEARVARRMQREYIMARYPNGIFNPKFIRTEPGKFSPHKYPRYVFLCEINAIYREQAHADRT
jgi:hypothetical protein